MNKEKNIITNKQELCDWCVEINPIKESKLTQEIVVALKDTMRKHNLVSLAAPQIGYAKRIFCLKFGKGDYRTFINPAIENNTTLSIVRECCSSIPDKRFVIPRFNKIKVYYVTPLGKTEGNTLIGIAAQRFQHAMDHLNGILVDDLGMEIDELFDNATEDEKTEILQMYAESLDLRQKSLKEEIEQDDELKNIDDAIRFINSVKDGTTTLDNVKNLEETKTNEQD